MRLKDLLKGVDVMRPDPLPEAEVIRISDDSRYVAEGGLFIAVKGALKDGAKYADDAVSKGAAIVVSESNLDSALIPVKVIVKDSRKSLALIADNFYGSPTSTLKTIGVTGTNGKTTITYVLESILHSAGIQCGVIGTVNHRMQGEVTKSKNTTPGALELQSLLSRMLKRGAQFAVMEMSSHSLDQGRVDSVNLDAAIFTNITPEHLDYHRDMERYFAAKKKIFRRLKNGGSAILNNDDRAVARLKKALKVNVLTYGLKFADVVPRDIALSLDGSRFTVVTPKGEIEITTKLIGMHNISNIMACIAAALHFDIDFKSVRDGIERLSTVPGRLERIEEGQPFKVFVDYAHTEDALRNALSILRERSTGKIITVFGCGGDRDKSKRPLMGKAACTYSDRVVITSDNPRYERPEDIISQIEGGVRGNFLNYTVEPDRKKAITWAMAAAGRDDIILIAGKGHEDYQIVKDKILKFDDRDISREILRGMKIEGQKDIRDNAREAVVG